MSMSPFALRLEPRQQVAAAERRTGRFASGFQVRSRPMSILVIQPGRQSCDRKDMNVHFLGQERCWNQCSNQFGFGRRHLIRPDKSSMFESSISINSSESHTKLSTLHKKGRLNVCGRSYQLSFSLRFGLPMVTCFTGERSCCF